MALQRGSLRSAPCRSSSVARPPSMMATPPDWRRKSVINDEVSAAGWDILKLVSFRKWVFVCFKVVRRGSVETTVRLQVCFGLTGVFIEYRGCGNSHPRFLHISNNVLSILNVYFPAPSVYKSCIHILRESFNLTKYSGRELLLF